MSNRLSGGTPFPLRVRIGTGPQRVRWDGVTFGGDCAAAEHRSFKVRRVIAMMRFHPLFVVVLGLAVAGCGNEAAGPSGNGAYDPFGLWSSTGEETYGQLHTTAMWYQKSDVVNYRSGGEIYSSLTTHNQNTFVSGGAMVAGNLSIPELYPGAYEAASGTNGPTFGATTVWSLSGNSSVGIPSFTDSLYVPAEIRITTPTASTDAVSNAQPLSITWNADGNNESILIILDYMVDESLMRDSTLTTKDYRWTTITDDDGSYTVSPSDLAGLPSGGLFQIILARGASKKSGMASHPFHVYAYSTATGMYAVTQ